MIQFHVGIGFILLLDRCDIAILNRNTFFPERCFRCTQVIMNIFFVYSSFCLNHLEMGWLFAEMLC